MLLLLISLLFAVPGRCVTLPAGVESWQIFIDSDGDGRNGYAGAESLVRGLEKIDAWHYHVRVTAENDCNWAHAGGWGKAIEQVEVIGGMVVIPMALVPPGSRFILETYTDGAMKSHAAANATACGTICGLGDFDGDCDVDLADYAIFQASFGG